MEKPTVAMILRILVDENIITEDQSKQSVEVLQRHLTTQNINYIHGWEHYYTCHDTGMAWYKNPDGSIYHLFRIKDYHLGGMIKKISIQGNWRWKVLNGDPFHMIDEGISSNFYEALYEVQTDECHEVNNLILRGGECSE